MRGKYLPTIFPSFPIDFDSRAGGKYRLQSGNEHGTDSNFVDEDGHSVRIDSLASLSRFGTADYVFPSPRSSDLRGLIRIRSNRNREENIRSDESGEEKRRQLGHTFWRFWSQESESFYNTFTLRNFLPSEVFFRFKSKKIFNFCSHWPVAILVLFDGVFLFQICHTLLWELTCVSMLRCWR